MAIELLVRAVNNVNPSADPATLWKQGEVVLVRQLPHGGWGTKENLAGGFWRITIDGINENDPRVELLLGSHDALTDGRLLARRKRWLDISALPNRIRNALNSTGEVVVRANEVAGLDLATKTRL